MIRVDRATALPPAVLVEANGIGQVETTRAIAHYRDGAGKRPVFKAYKAGAVRKALEALFHGKCAYCESRYRATTPVDVEHFRPKGAVTGTTGQPKGHGYYWLAAAWPNLLPSCIDCNRRRGQITLPDGRKVTSGKAAWFPLSDESRRASVPGEEALEVPLLLNPCEDDPILHLEFFEKDNEVAILRPRIQAAVESPRGAASIEIYGLNRSGLVAERREHLARITGALMDLQSALALLDGSNPRTEAVALDLLKRKLADLDALGRPQSRYAALARHAIDPTLANLRDRIAPEV